ncbi:mCG147277 [Mus musculus]|nr:mCG147277 [Mus musculus]
MCGGFRFFSELLPSFLPFCGRNAFHYTTDTRLYPTASCAQLSNLL